MNLNDNRYKQYAICREMLETTDVIKNFHPEVSEKYKKTIQSKGKLLLTGEGSSRLFPAKHLLYRNAISPSGIQMFTEGATQAMEYPMQDYAIMGASNSGKTKELLRLLFKLKEQGHDAIFGVTANTPTPMEECTHLHTILTCGREDAVAATKSVVEQALFYHSLHFNLLNLPMTGLNKLADQMKETLEISIDPIIIQKLLNAPVLYFAGRNNGVAEEITLKTNEIARKRSGYLEGTYAVHGIEEVLEKRDVVIIFEPFPEEEEKFQQVFVQNIGVEVIAISARPTRFPTLLIPEGGVFRNYLELAMGWNLLTEIGIEQGLNLDKPVHARKIGNEFKMDGKGNI